MSEIAAFIDTVIDSFVVTRKKPKASFTQFLKSQDIDRRTINDFVDNKLNFITDQIEELSIALDGDDEVVKEGYGNFRRPELRDFKELLNQIVDDLYAYKNEKELMNILSMSDFHFALIIGVDKSILNKPLRTPQEQPSLFNFDII